LGEVSYVNGQLVQHDEASISVIDRGLLFGDGLFEVIRVYGGYPFQLNAHLQRLGWGARKIGFDLGVSLDSLKQACLDTLAANDLKEAVIRVVVTRGVLADMNHVSATAKPTVAVTCDEFHGHPANLYDRGVEAITVTDGRSDLAMVQTLNFLPNLIARKEAEQKRAFEALLVTKKGFVMSGSTSNVFAVLDGILLTPPVGERVPPGITREAVLNAAQKEGITVKEDAIMNEELHDSEEFFLTGTLCEVMPVISINGRPVGDGRPGHQTQRLMKAYKLMTRRAY
jgi:D-amino acid aminotransferase